MTDHGGGMVNNLVNALCVQPVEIPLSRLHFDQTGEVTSSTHESKPGIVLVMETAQISEKGIRILHVSLGLSRETIIGLRDILGAYLDDGGHLHWEMDGEIERQPDLHIDAEDAEMFIPDTLDGLT